MWPEPASDLRSCALSSGHAAWSISGHVLLSPGQLQNLDGRVCIQGGAAVGRHSLTALGVTAHGHPPVTRDDGRQQIARHRQPRISFLVKAAGVLSASHRHRPVPAPHCPWGAVGGRRGWCPAALAAVSTRSWWCRCCPIHPSFQSL